VLDGVKCPEEGLRFFSMARRAGKRVVHGVPIDKMETGLGVAHQQGESTASPVTDQ
jgi:hypothetical protein